MLIKDAHIFCQYSQYAYIQENLILIFFTSYQSLEHS